MPPHKRRSTGPEIHPLVGTPKKMAAKKWREKITNTSSFTNYQYIIIQLSPLYHQSPIIINISSFTNISPIYHWVVVSNVFFHPYSGEDSHFDEHIFPMGWFNHQREEKNTKWLSIGGDVAYCFEFSPRKLGENMIQVDDSYFFQMAW